jgi:cytochrome c oxidase assembly factor CtaG/polyferredoxin
VNPVAQAILASWTIRPGAVILLLVVGGVYARGFRELHVQMPERFPRWRLGAFLAGLATLLVAIASPLDAFGGLLLQVHMIQHLLLMLVAPPLLLLGAPAVPLLRGLPRRLAKDGLGPFLASPALQRLGHALTHPVVGWLALTAVTWGWHVPAAYQLALRSPAWHAIEHGCFVIAALLFWWPVVLPWPSRAHWPRWAIVPYLLLADVQNTIFSAFFTFSDRLIYPFYASVPRLGRITPLDDQIAAGAIMWVPASLFFLIPAVAVMLRALSPQSLTRGSAAGMPALPSDALRAASALRARRRRFDLLEVPGIGRMLRWPHFRRVAQGVMLTLAVAVVADGLLGPQMSPMNLAGVLPWTYWRGFTVLALLATGNLFCLACPFMLPREVARRLGLGYRQWPRWLRSKWFAVGLLVAFFWAYEILDLWDSPRWTAWLIVGYFAGALVVDSVFKGASFCKYVCPIGQFHFVQSLVSPLELQVCKPQACASCTTHDCLRGNERHRGCELDLFLPRKVGNIDCTFCLDCIQACPHDNIGIFAVAPGSTLIHDPQRSALGRLSRRADVAALAGVLVFAAFASAAAMVEPMNTWQQQIAHRLALDSPKPVMSIMLLLALVIAPPVVCGLAALGGRFMSGIKAPARELRHRFGLALVPLGLAMWTAHFLFHLLTGFGSVVPVVQRMLADLGHDFSGAPRWVAAPMNTDLLGFEILLLDAGLLLSLYVGWRIASSYAPLARTALGLVTPWAIVAVALYLSGVWAFLQPMQMRGTMTHAPRSVAMAHQ